jgi:transposase
MVATAGSASHFPSGRQFAAWLGITPRESSSGFRHNLGRITKRGDVYLRTLLIHGARSVLVRAQQLNRIDPARLSRLQQWGLQLQRRVGHNKAAVAMANKLARICWAVWRTESAYQPGHGA